MSRGVTRNSRPIGRGQNSIFLIVHENDNCSQKMNVNLYLLPVVFEITVHPESYKG